MQMVRSGHQLVLRLHKDLTRSIKRGHAWLYSDAIDLPKAPAGSVAKLLDRKDQVIASGIYDPDHPIPLRICSTRPPFELNQAWIDERLRLAHSLRVAAFDESTTGYRLVAGEGDGLPGLIVDVYEQTGVIKLDGGAPEVFYQPEAIAQWLKSHLGLNSVVLRSRGRGVAGQALLGSLPPKPVSFLENGLLFTADVVQGQKTGFFLDQRDNRNLIRQLAKGCSVLNLFSFNGGFSVAAGVGGAASVTSVDIAAPAIEAAKEHWHANHLTAAHDGRSIDCFSFLEEAIRQRKKWDLVICDPPSFAPSERARERAAAAYGKLAQLSSRVTATHGMLALASCSSHIDAAAFTRINYEALGRARRKATLLVERGLPVDHPTPFAMPELRYLKFQLFRLD